MGIVCISLKCSLMMCVCIRTNYVAEHKFALGMICLCLICFPFFFAMPLYCLLDIFREKNERVGEIKYQASMGNKKSIATLLKKQTCRFHLFELNFNFKAKH